MLPFGLSPKSGVLPTFVILLPSTRTAAFLTGLPPLPSISLALRNRVGASGMSSVMCSSFQPVVPATIGFESDPMPSISTRTTSPGCR